MRSKFKHRHLGHAAYNADLGRSGSLPRVFTGVAGAVTLQAFISQAFWGPGTTE